MVALPTILVVWLVWLPALASVCLSFTKWNGFRLSGIQWIGTKNYLDIATIYPRVLAGDPAQPDLVGVLLRAATPLGMLLAVILDREMWGSRFYQTAFYLPVVLSLALVGFIWQLFYSTDQGLINQVLGTQRRLARRSRRQPVGGAGGDRWRHTGYIMLLYLAGLKGVDSTLREAAAVDGANEVKTFFQVIFPVMRPINLIVVVIVVIESLRAFDLVWVINKGRNGLELISALVSQNVIGEATRYGFGSALAVIMMVISSVFIIIYLRDRLPGGPAMSATTTVGPVQAKKAAAADRAVESSTSAAARSPRSSCSSWRSCGCSRCCGPCTTRSATTPTPRPTGTSPSAGGPSTTTGTRGAGASSACT